MRTNQTLDEARKYLLYVADALQAIASSHSVDKQDRVVLDKYASDLFEYSKNIDQLKNIIIAKDEVKKKLHIIAELEYAYDTRKRNAVKAHKAVHVVKEILKKAEESKIDRDILEAKQRLEYYTKQAVIAQQNELIAQRELEHGA